jgi:DHA1 family bicyclomycin/chloramphenicol resistance-like MFS transporter
MSARPKQGQGEFICLVAFLISLVALSIDAMLPALPAIGADLDVARANDTQLVIGLFFAGFAVGQLFYGPLSDSLGRKPVILAGLVLFTLGCLMALLALSFETVLAGRILQGLGAAAPRTVMLAVVRDRFAGRAMARVMSFVMAVFIIVPALAPTLGQGIMLVADWHAIFAVLMALAVGLGLWMMLRLPETLPHPARVPLSAGRIVRAMGEVVTTRAALGYTLAAGTVFGAFIGYLNSSQQVFQVTFGVGELFPAFFAVLALAIGASSLVNARLVMGLGMRRLSFTAVFTLTGLSVGFAAVTVAFGGLPPLWAFMLWGVASFFCIGILFGNLNALAMEPLGHIAGTGAAVVGSLSTALSLLSGIAIGQVYDGTVLPLVSGFAVLGALSAAVMLITDRGVGGREKADCGTV